MKTAISMVLVEPENPDNVGAVARAMKNMGLRDLRLVKPPRGWKRRGRKMAMKARDTLEAARVFGSVREAVGDARLVIGTTRRSGPKRGIFIAFPAALRKITAAGHAGVAILFGKESKGLSNRDLAMCDWVATIPSHPDYPSINLAQAVMIIGFSIFTAVGRRKYSISDVGAGLKPAPTIQPVFVSKKEMSEVLDRFREALSALNYEEEGRDVHARIVTTLHRLLKRSGLLTSEARMLKGLSRRICERYNTRHG